MTDQPKNENRPTKAKRQRPTLDEIPFAREAPVLASATMIVLRHVGAWLRAGDEDSGGFWVRLGSLGLTSYVAIYLAGKHPVLWWAYGGSLFLVVTAVAVRTGLSAGRTVKDLEAAAQTDENPQETNTQDDHEGAGEQDAGSEPPTASPAEADAAFSDFVEHNVAFAVREGRKGVHTDSLLKILHTAGMLTDWTEPMLRQKCRCLDIPVRTQMSIRGRNYFGVHVEDLEHALNRTLRLPPQLVPDLTPNTPAVPPAEPPAPPSGITLVKPPAPVA